MYHNYGKTPATIAPLATRAKLPPSQLRIRATWSVSPTTKAAIEARAREDGYKNGGRLLDAQFGEK